MIGATSALVMATLNSAFAFVMVETRRGSVPGGMTRGLSGGFCGEAINAHAASAQSADERAFFFMMRKSYFSGRADVSSVHPGAYSRETNDWRPAFRHRTPRRAERRRRSSGGAIPGVSRDDHTTAAESPPLLLANDGLGIGRRRRRPGSPVPGLSKTGHVRRLTSPGPVVVPHRP